MFFRSGWRPKRGFANSPSPSGKITKIPTTDMNGISR